jgi:hypothetical protein
MFLLSKADKELVPMREADLLYLNARQLAEQPFVLWVRMVLADRPVAEDDGGGICVVRKVCEYLLNNQCTF